MTNPQPSQNNRNIRGKPLDLDELLDLATIDLADIESAAQWFDDHASAQFVGALDVTPTDENVTNDDPTE